MCIRRNLAAWGSLLLLAIAVPLYAKPIDSTLFTTYTAGSTQVNLVVCGSLPQTEGCYGSASLGPFGRVGAMIEGSPVQSVKKGTVTRYIYVVDVAAGSGANEVFLYVYKKVDTITQSDDTVSVTTCQDHIRVDRKRRRLRQFQCSATHDAFPGVLNWISSTIRH